LLGRAIAGPGRGTDRAACESRPVAHMEAARQAVGGSEYGTRKPRAGRGSLRAPWLASGACQKSHPGSGLGWFPTILLLRQPVGWLLGP